MLQDLAELAAVGAAKGELLDGVETVADPIERDKRAQQPRAQQTPGHGGDRSIDLVQQRTLAAAIHRLDDFEVLERDRVDQQAVRRCLVGDAADVREIGFLRVAQIVEQCAGCRHGRRMSIEPEPFEPVGAKLVDQRSGARIRARTSRLDARHRQPITGAVEQHAAQIEIDCRDNLARPQHHHFVCQRLKPRRPRVFGAGKLACRQIQQRDPDNRVRPAIWDSGLAIGSDSRNAGARSSRCCESVSVPGDTTRTISRLTIPLAFFGSST